MTSYNKILKTPWFQALKVYEDAVAAGILTSVFQRPSTMNTALKSAPVWTDLELAAVELTPEDREAIVQAVIYKGSYTYFP